MHVQALKILLKIWNLVLNSTFGKTSFQGLINFQNRKWKTPPIFAVEITKQSDKIYKKQIICCMVHLRRKANRYLLWQRKVTWIPFSVVSSFPFIAVYLADARGKCDEAGELTYCKLRASGKLLVSTPLNLPKATSAFSCNLFSSIFTL